MDIRWTLAKTNYNNGNLLVRYQPGSGSQVSVQATSMYNNSTDAIYYFKYIYDPSLSSKKMKIYNMWTNTEIGSSNNTLGASNLKITIGYAINMAGENYRYSNLQVYEFNVKKL